MLFREHFAMDRYEYAIEAVARSTASLDQRRWPWLVDDVRAEALASLVSGGALESGNLAAINRRIYWHTNAARRRTVVQLAVCVRYPFRAYHEIVAAASSGQLDGGDVPDAVDNAADPALIAEHGEAAGIVREALRRLPATERKAVWLRVVEGESFDRIAAEIGVTTGVGAAGIVRRGLRRLRGGLAHVAAM